MEISNETNCPGCERHCPAQSPRCNWGRAHFNMEPVEERKPLTWEQKKRRR